MNLSFLFPLNFPDYGKSATMVSPYPEVYNDPLISLLDTSNCGYQHNVFFQFVLNVDIATKPCNYYFYY